MADATRQRRPRHLNALDRVRDVDFPIVLRGYDRQAVDDYVAEIAQLVAELEATQLRESVVQRALDEVGEQTSSILQRAHEAAEEIAARSRAQAEGRIQRAEREAEILRRDADEYAEQVVVDTKRLWEERQRLLEEIRGLADEVLATADDALERVKEPEMLRREREAAEGPQEPTAAAVLGAEHPLDTALDEETASVVERDPVTPGDEEIAAALDDEEPTLLDRSDTAAYGDAPLADDEGLGAGDEDELTADEKDELDALEEDEDAALDDDADPAPGGDDPSAEEEGDQPTAEFKAPPPPDQPA
jgi:DivIVA domain-containing protein